MKQREHDEQEDVGQAVRDRNPDQRTRFPHDRGKIERDTDDEKDVEQ